MKKSITTVSIILLTLVLSACDSKEKKAFIRGCAEGLADKSICSCAYDKLNGGATKMYGKEWGTNPAILQDERFFYALQKAAMQCE